MNEKDTNWFRPLWRRVLVTAIIVAWFGYETLFTHDSLWISITAIGIAYCAWNFFIRFPRDNPAPPADSTPPKRP
jgi:hypothetical protein